MGIRSTLKEARKDIRSRIDNKRAAQEQTQATLHQERRDAQERFAQEAVGRKLAYRLDRCANYGRLVDKQLGRFALVTNFSSHGFRSPDSIASTLEKAVVPADLTVIEVILPNERYAPRQDEFMKSAQELRDAMQEQRPGDHIVVAEEPIIEQGMIVPESIAGRIEDHISQNPGKSFSYVAVTSALELNNFGHRAENGMFGAQGEVYESIVGGAVLTPPREGAQDPTAAWQIWKAEQ